MVTETNNMPLIIGVVAMAMLGAVLMAFLPDDKSSESAELFQKTGSASNVNKAMTRGPDMAERPLDDIPRDQALSPEVLKRLALIKELNKRFTDGELRSIARASLDLELRTVEDHGENDAAYALLEMEWAKLCKEKKITEAERDVIEDEALRQGWIKPLSD
jgi:hypothetical protein